MPNGKPAVPEEKRKERKGHKEAKQEGKRQYPVFPCFPESSLVFFPQFQKEKHPILPVREGRKNDPNRSIIRKHRVPEEKKKERKGKKEAKKEGQF